MDNISGYIQDILKLLVLFLLKTILIPIGFFYMFSKIVKGIWSTNWKKFSSQSLVNFDLLIRSFYVHPN